MRRRTLLTALSLASLAGPGALGEAMASFEPRAVRMPVLFVGHGSPMNAVTDSRWSRGWAEVAARLPRPEAILCVSAHWQTPGVMATAMERPPTIHDFYGFPDELHRKVYPAPGSPELAGMLPRLVQKAPVALDQAWGLDHGTWSVLCRMWPGAEIPVIQLSLDQRRDAAWHYELGRELRPLRDRGVLLMGSGNIVHNLRRLDRGLPDGGSDWAVEFDARVAALIDAGDHRGAIEYDRLGRAAALSVPTNEHYLPLLYALAARDAADPVAYFNAGLTMGGISMRSLVIG